MTRFYKLAFIFVFVVIQGCGGSSSESSNNTNQQLDSAKTTPASALSAPGTTRDWLTLAQLQQSDYPHASPIHNGYFAAVGDALPARHDFSGQITLLSRQLIGAFNEFYIEGEASFKLMPEVSLEFVSDNGYLIPLNRARQFGAGDGSFWGLILDPGKVWSEASDSGWSRASFPFTLISQRRNQAHNGVASFLYNDTEMTNLWVQVTQETALWFRHNLFGQLETNYHKKNYENQGSVVNSFALELANTVEILPWQQLDQLSTAALTKQYNSQQIDSTLSATGVIIDGTVYAQPCYTRYGNYPYCRFMRQGAYSVTKSLGASLTMLRLAQKYGEQVYDLKIKDYVTVTAYHNGWQNVTFGDVLNMAVGVGTNGAQRGSGDIFADENTPTMERWLVRPTLEQKLQLSFEYGNYPWQPGEIFRYNSAMTIVLAAALANYYKQVEGADADLWHMMLTEVFNPIGIQHVPILKTSEFEAQNQIPELFHGLYLNVDDLAKLTTLLQNEGNVNGEQLLHLSRLQQSLFKTDHLGLASWWEDNEFGRSYYINGFWSSPFADDENCFSQIPYMSGYGGNIVAVMPNKMVLYRFADGNSYSPANMIKAANNERHVCN